MPAASLVAQVNITKLPYTITKPGRYQLYNSYTYNGIGYAITINANDVSLDLRGKTITGNRTVSLTNETAAIFANGRSNITVYNGTITNFFRGIYIEGDPATQEGHIVRDMKVYDGTFLGIQVKGRDSIIQNNTVARVALDGGATSYTAMRYGMDLMGESLHVSGNRVLDVQLSSNNLSGDAYGIYIHDANGSIVERNNVSNTSRAYPSYNLQPKRGIFISNAHNVVVTENRCISFHLGLYLNDCFDGLYSNNTVTGNAAAAYTNTGNFGLATDGGGNQ